MKSHEFTYEGNPWRIGDWDGCCVKFGVSPPIAEHFVAFGQAFSPDAAWIVLRMRYAINPLLPDPDIAEEYLTPMKFKDIQEALGIDEKAVKQLMEMFWEEWQPFQDTIELDTDEPKEEVKSARTEITEEIKEMLFAYGFTDGIFNVHDDKLRTNDERMAEVNWFVGRLSQLQVIFNHPTANAMGRQIVNLEMHLRRVDARLSNYDVESDRYDSLTKKKKSMSDNLRAMWGQAKEFVPQLGEHEKKISLAGCISDVIKGYREYCANDDNTIIDGLLTQFELQVMTRHAPVFNTVRHRPGFSAAIAEAKKSIMDPAFQRKMSDRDCRILDQAYRDAILRWSEAHPSASVDLEIEGPGGEFPPIYKPDPESEIDEVPAINVEI